MGKCNRKTEQYINKLQNVINDFEEQQEYLSNTTDIIESKQLDKRIEQGKLIKEQNAQIKEELYKKEQEVKSILSGYTPDNKIGNLLKYINTKHNKDISDLFEPKVNKKQEIYELSKTVNSKSSFIQTLRDKLNTAWENILTKNTKLTDTEMYNGFEDKINKYMYSNGKFNNLFLYDGDLKDIFYTGKTYKSEPEIITKDGRFYIKTGDVEEEINAYIAPFLVPIKQEDKYHLVLIPEISAIVKTILPKIISKILRPEFISKDKVAQILGFDEYEKVYNEEDLLKIDYLYDEFRSKGFPEFEVATLIGQTLLAELNVKINKQYPRVLKEKLELSLGQFILHNLQEASTLTNAPIQIEKNNIKANSEVGSNAYTTYKIKVNTTKEKLEEFDDFLHKYITFTDKLSLDPHKQKAPVSVNKDIIVKDNVKKTIATEVSDEVTEFIDKEQNVIYEANNAFEHFLNLDEDTAILIAGGENMSNINLVNYNNTLSKNKDFKRRIEALKLYKDIIKQGFKVPWYQAKNLRTMMDNAISPQDNKVHRHTTRTLSQKKTIVLRKNNPNLKLFKLALTQAFDLGTDKLRDETVLFKLDDMLDIITSGSNRGIHIKNNKLQKAFDAVNSLMTNKELTEEQNKDIVDFIKTTEGMHGFHALVELVNLDKALKNKQTKFETDLHIETDAITSGMVLTILNALMIENNPTTQQYLIDLLAKGGVYHEKTKTFGIEDALSKEQLESLKDLFNNNKLTHGKLLDPENKNYKKLHDFYNTLAHYLTIDGKNVEKNIKEEFKEEKDPLKKTTLAAQLKLFNLFKDGNGELKFSRSLVKPAQMVFTYGAMVHNIIKKMFNAMVVDNLNNDFLNHPEFKKLTIKQLMTIIKPNNNTEEEVNKLDIQDKEKLIKYVSILKSMLYQVNKFTIDKDTEQLNKILMNDPEKTISKLFDIYQYNELQDNVTLLNTKDIDLETLLNTPLKNIGIKQKVLNDYFKYVYNYSFGNMFRSVFNKYIPITKFREKLQNISSVIYTSSINTFYKKMENNTGKSMDQWTEEDYKNTVQEMINEGIWYDLPSVFHNAEVPLENENKGDKGSLVKINSLQSISSIAVKLKEFTDNKIAVSPVMAHQLDSKIIMDAISGSENEVTHIFDALLFGMDMDIVNKQTYKYNEATLKNNIKYNIYIATLEKLYKIIKNEETFKSLKEHLDTLDTESEEYLNIMKAMNELFNINTYKNNAYEILNNKIIVGHNYAIDSEKSLYIHTGVSKDDIFKNHKLNFNESLIKQRLKELGVDIKTTKQEQSTLRKEQQIKVKPEKEKGSSSVSYLGSKTGEQTITSKDEAISFLNNIISKTKQTLSENTLNTFKNTIGSIFEYANKINIHKYINNTFNRGSALITSKTLKLSKGLGLSIQSEAEVYTHEMFHLLTHKALKEDRQLKTRSIQLMKQIKSIFDNDPEINSETFFIPNYMSHTSEAKSLSKELYTYAFSDPEEFLIIAMSNPKLNNYINKNLNNIKIKDDIFEGVEENNVIDKVFNYIIKAFNKLFSAFTLNRKTIDQEMNDIFITAVNFTNAIYQGTYKPNEPKLFELVYNHLGKITKSLGYKAVTNPLFDTIKNLYSRVADELDKGMFDTLAKSEAWRDRVFKIQQNTKKLQINIVQFTRDIIKEMFISNKKFDDFYEIYNQIKYLQETQRMQQETANIKVLESVIPFKDKKSLRALTNTILRTDLTTLDPRRVNIYLSDTNKLYKRINDLENKIKYTTYGQAKINQAKALGFYLVTGSSTIDNLVLNAHNIDNLYFLNDTERVSTPNLRKEIDELTTLYALTYSNKEDLDITRKYFNEHYEEAKNLMAYTKHFLKQESDKLFDNDIHRAKGYIRPKSNNIYETRVVSEEQLKLYKSYGWQKVKEIDNDPKESKKYKTYLVKRLNTEPSYTKGAFEITGNTTLGISITDKYMNAEDNTIDSQLVSSIITKLKENSEINVDRDFDPVKEYTKLKENKESKVVPLLNLNGDIVNYRYTVHHTDMETLQGEDLDIRSVVANTQSHIYLKFNGNQLNKHLIDYFKKAYDPSKPNLYVKVGVETTENGMFIKHNENYYDILPDSTKEYLKNNGGYIYVNKYLLNDVFGYKDATLANMPILKKPYMKKTRELVKKGEKLWKDLIKLLKPVIVITNGAVLFGNFMSNFFVLTQFMSPTEAYRNIKRNWLLYNQLNKDLNEFRYLESKIKANIASKEEKTRHKILFNAINKNPLNKLVESGIVGSIIEDVTVSNINDTNFISNWINNKIGEKIKNSKKLSLLKSLFLAEESSPFKKMLKIMQYSDVVAKQTLLEYYLKQGKSYKDALIEADEYFVNYNINQNKYLKYLNDTGLLMFTKFLLRTVKIVLRTIGQHPEKALRLDITNSIVDIPEIYEPYTKDLTDILMDRNINVLQESFNYVNPYTKWDRVFSY